MDLLHTEFKRKFSFSSRRELTLPLFKMTFTHDFVNEKKGDVYPVLEKSEGAAERVEENRYTVESGSVTRLAGQFFPYATNEMTVSPRDGAAGFRFLLPEASASVTLTKNEVRYTCGDKTETLPLPTARETRTMLVACRPGAFDVYFRENGKAELFHTFAEEAFAHANAYAAIAAGKVAVTVEEGAALSQVLSYMDNGNAIADMRPIRYENGEIMMESGKVYFTASVRLQEEQYQGIFSWVPGTAELALTGALFFDCGDGKWCNDVASSVLYHREAKKWLLWVCSFSHGHILAHGTAEGELRFGVNVIDVTVMEEAPKGTPTSEFLGFFLDEDPDFIYDEKSKRWLLSVCRADAVTKKYRYHFFESYDPFTGYRYIGQGFPGEETGGSFVRVEGELYFLCGNSYSARSDYRIYHKDGMSVAKFDYPDGGFRGWGTLMPVKQASRTRYYWLTFDRARSSDTYEWSYGNLYCFEAM